MKRNREVSWEMRRNIDLPPLPLRPKPAAATGSSAEQCCTHAGLPIINVPKSYLVIPKPLFYELSSAEFVKDKYAVHMIPIVETKG